MELLKEYLYFVLKSTFFAIFDERSAEASRSLKDRGIKVFGRYTLYSMHQFRDRYVTDICSMIFADKIIDAWQLGFISLRDHNTDVTQFFTVLVGEP